MSELIVEVVKIIAIDIHPNADRLDLATVKGWQCVCQKDAFEVGQKVVYLPIDSILPSNIEAKLFPPGSKITLTKSRIRTIRIRSAISQGMIVTLSELGLSDSIKVGTDVRKKLSIEKYEPQVKQPNMMSNGSKRSKKQLNSNFRKYSDIQHLKNYMKAFENKQVIITEKIHGTNFRAGYVKYNKHNLWRRLLKLLHIGSNYQFVFGSHNVQLQSLLNKKKTYYKKNVYLEAVNQYKLKDSLKDNEVIYGEIYGDGIQKNYSYGCSDDQRKLVIFDVMIDGEYLDTQKAIGFCKERDLDYVPILFTGEYSKEVADDHVSGKSVLAPKAQPVREGCVISTIEEEMMFMGRSVLKYINPKYLLKDQSEWH
jgi:RNA ligase (TIGR02306 family)